MIRFNRQGLALLLVLATPTHSDALTVLPGFSFMPSTNAPLAGTLTIDTDAASRVSVSVNDGKSTWKRDFHDFGTHHSEILLGFKSGRTNRISATVHDAGQNIIPVAGPLTFITALLPADMPAIRLLTNQVEKMEAGYTLFRVDNSTVVNLGNFNAIKADHLTARAGYVTIVDKDGEVVWYSDRPSGSAVLQLANGDLFYPVKVQPAFEEINMLGQTVRTWKTPTYIDPHEDFITDHGTILYFTRYIKLDFLFPSSVTERGAPLVHTNYSYYRVMEISSDLSTADPATGYNLLNVFPLESMLDPARFNYLPYQLSPTVTDTQHANSILEDPKDHSLIVCLRNQDAVIKFSRQGRLQWILSPHNNWRAPWQRYLLNPVGKPFQWSYGEHSPVLTPHGTLLLFDNGNCRAEPFDPGLDDKDNYSRAVEYRIDEAKMEVSQVWEYADTNRDRLFANTLGAAMWLPHTSNVLVTFGAVTYENGKRPDPVSSRATIARIKEVTHDAHPQVVFDLELSYPHNTDTNSEGCTVYRSYRIPDLYSSH